MLLKILLVVGNGGCEMEFVGTDESWLQNYTLVLVILERSTMTPTLED